MKINKEKSTFAPPYKVIILDALDAYYYADVMAKMELYDEFEDYGKACAIADALFVLKNYRWESLEEMNMVDDGYDIRVYDQNMSCLHAAHTTFKDNWIGSNYEL